MAGCAAEYVPKEEPSFYRNLAQPGAQLDAAAAASMISGYRTNNGLAAVTLDPELTRLAEAQAAIMAKRDKLDHNAGKPFVVRLKASGYDAKIGGRKYRRRLSHVGRSFLRLARFGAASRQYVARGRDPHGHRSDLHAGFEIQSVLGADPGRAGRSKRLAAGAFIPIFILRIDRPTVA